MGIRSGGRLSSLLIFCVNLALIGATVAVFVLYSISYRDKLREQNLADIANINQAAASISSAFFRNQEKRLTDAVRYGTMRAFTRDEMLSYICDANSDENSGYELIAADGRGFASVRQDDGFAAVDYTSGDYAALRQVFAAADTPADGVLCTPEFTDRYTARRSFALYDYIDLRGENGGTERMTLLAVFRSSDFSGLIALDGGYTGLSTVLVTDSGDYVLGSSAFKSDNLFQYFYVFSGLSLDERNRAAADFAAGTREFYYRNSLGQDCVYLCADVPDTAWHCVSCVPLSSFHDAHADLRFTALVAALLLALAGFNVLWLDGANRRLRVSARREKESSAAKTDFLSRMSHDIRTPLNVVIGTTLLARREQNPPATQKYLENIDQSGRFLLSLVNDILDLNKVESGKMELRPVPSTLRQFASDMNAIIAPLCQESGLHFTISGCDSDTAYLFDPVRLNQIFFNILSNSVKFTPAGGRVGLDCSVSARAEGGAELAFRAWDNGQGMSPAFQAHMFDAFSQEQADGNSQGTGLGLAIVRNLVRLMDGTVRVESAPGAGTVFYIRIPVQVSAQAAPEPETAGADAALLAGKHVLLFEDNRINAEIAQTLLEDRGMTVDRAADGREGLERFAAAAPGTYDLILMDLRMPVMNGLDAARAIRALPRPDAAAVPIVAMTANAYDVDVDNCLRAGMNAHLSKPIDPARMYATLAHELAAARRR